MKKILLAALFAAAACTAQAQKTENDNASRKRLGLKSGYNWSYVTASAAGVSTDSKSGFMLGAYFAPQVKKGMGFRSEVVFSRQGYSFDEGGKNTAVLNDYIYLPQLTTFNVGKAVQLQLGGQIGFLMNSKLSGVTGAKDSSITSLMNRIDYGFAGGVELRPFKGLMIGGRYNLGLGKLYKKFEQSVTDPNPYPLPFNPETTNMKNGVVQLFVGYEF